MVMMPIALAVRRDVNQLRSLSRLRKSAEQSLGEALAVIQQPLKGHSLRDRPIIKKQVDLLLRRQDGDIGVTGINLPSAHVLPLRFSQQANSLSLARCQNCKPDSVLCQNLERFAVHRRFWQPHSFRLAPEARFE